METEKELRRKRVRCPLCPPKSNKRYSMGRGLRDHVLCIHASAEEEEEETTKKRKVVSKETLELADQVIAQVQEMLETGEHIEETKQNEDESAVVRWQNLAKQGDIKALEAMNQAGEWKWDDKDKHGAIAEHFAAGAGHLECVKYCVRLRRESCLVHSGSEKDDGEQAPMCTCVDNLKRMKRNDGRTSLHWAARNGHSKVLAWLVDHGVVSVDAETYDGTTPLHMAVLGVNVDVARELLRLGAKRTGKNRWSCALTHWLGLTTSKDENKILAMCEWLRKDLCLAFHALNKEGHSIIHKAAFKGNVTILNWCIKNLEREEMEKACVPDKGGQTPSVISQRCNHHEFSELVKTFETNILQ